MRRVLFGMVVLITLAAPVGAAAQVQIWSPRPDDPVWRAEQLRLQRERWRNEQDLRLLESRMDQLRTDAVVRDIQARRDPAGGVIPLDPAGVVPVAPALVAPDPSPTRSSQEGLEQGLNGLRGWLNQTRPD
ncbi:hypothetical protein [Brevundimonas aveniformis]|uniref:hypothetical protein n=1 Tax=Brevundimonas aveniformis TaxID=370977 RepID=UPI002492F6B5|nr:hypothetical protein [Brevundimonas aveniformis]